MLASRVYPPDNSLERKADETFKSFALLMAATASNRKTNSNLATTVASLVTEPSLSNKHILSFLRDNAHLKRLLGQCRIGSSMIKKWEQVDPPPSTHYHWLCGYDSGHPSFECTGHNTGHVMNLEKSNIQGVSEKNKQV